MKQDLFSLDDTYFMRQALLQAKLALDSDEIPVGVVVVSHGVIIAKSYNLTQALNDVTAHAEMQAITAAANYLGAKYLKDCTMYITLEPCPMCAGALYWSQIDRVVFAAKDTRTGYKTMGSKLHPKTKITSGVLEQEAKALLQHFFKEKRKK